MADARVTLAACPPGPFLFGNILGFKTEYPLDLAEGPRGMPDAYCMESGECFWGGAETHEERAALLVTPVDVRTAVRPRLTIRILEDDPRSGTRIGSRGQRLPPARYFALCDERGEPLPLQQACRVDMEAGEVGTIEVRFTIDHDDIRFWDDPASPADEGGSN